MSVHRAIHDPDRILETKCDGNSHVKDIGGKHGSGRLFQFSFTCSDERKHNFYYKHLKDEVKCDENHNLNNNSCLHNQNEKVLEKTEYNPTSTDDKAVSIVPESKNTCVAGFDQLTMYGGTDKFQPIIYWDGGSGHPLKNRTLYNLRKYYHPPAAFTANCIGPVAANVFGSPNTDDKKHDTCPEGKRIVGFKVKGHKDQNVWHDTPNHNKNVIVGVSNSGNTLFRKEEGWKFNARMEPICGPIRFPTADETELPGFPYVYPEAGLAHYTDKKYEVIMTEAQMETKNVLNVLEDENVNMEEVEGISLDKLTGVVRVFSEIPSMVLGGKMYASTTVWTRDPIRGMVSPGDASDDDEEEVTDTGVPVITTGSGSSSASTCSTEYTQQGYRDITCDGNKCVAGRCGAQYRGEPEGEVVCTSGTWSGAFEGCVARGGGGDKNKPISSNMLLLFAMLVVVLLMKR
jgi:hypothetical protein